ncbi:MAG TPA: DUF1573 domain-containing protein [Geobacteraceae bacterium]
MNPTLIPAAALIFLAQAAATLAAPQIAADRPVYDFGSVSQGTKVEHTFVIRNRGDAPLTIKAVHPACGCTAVATSATVIAPGKAGEIRTAFNSANYAGAVTKTVAVQSNDPKTPSAILTLRGTVVEEVQFAPRQLNLGQLRTGTTKKASITVTNRGKKPLRLTAVRSTMSQVAATVEKKLLKPGESGALLVTITPRRGDRLLSGYVSVSTDSPTKPEISVPVYGSQTN